MIFELKRIANFEIFLTRQTDVATVQLSPKQVVRQTDGMAVQLLPEKASLLPLLGKVQQDCA